MMQPLFFLLLCALSLGTLQASPTLAPGYGKLNYQPPAVGSYQLPVLGKAGDGEVLDASGQTLSLHQLFDGKYVLLSFIYSRCNDVNGCPLSTHVLYQIKSQMQLQPQLAKQLKLVSLSFDPAYDTPQVLRLYANNFKYAGNKGEWDFVSTHSEQALQPILQGYGQQIQREKSVQGKSGSISHVLRVFLIDPALNIRNIYSVAFLHKDILLNDINSLLLEASSHAGGTQKPAETPLVTAAGDDKRGYETAQYRTRSQALSERSGQAIDLLQLALNPPLGLPALPQPADNALTRDKIALGRKLFYDRRLSLNNTISCAMCHIPEQGFSSNELATAVGIEGRSVRRNSPTIYNVGYADILFHDGREFNLEQQIWGPLLAHNEMGNPSVGSVLSKIRQLPDYRGRFEQAFAGRGPDMQTLGQALASYQRTLLSADSPFDRWYYGNEAEALSPSAQRGFALFNARAGCSGCHLIDENAALLMDNRLHNTGVGYASSMGQAPATRPVQVAPGVFVEVDQAIIDRVAEAPVADVGQYEVTENPVHRWRYKTPTLRNIALTAPYMHDGSMATLEDVVAFYNAGGVTNPLLDSRIHPLGLDAQQQQDLVNFLKALTGSNVQSLVSDAFAAPIGDPAGSSFAFSASSP